MVDEQQPDEADDLYPLAPGDETSRPQDSLELDDRFRPQPALTPDAEAVQFSLKELFALVTVVAVLLGLLRLVPGGQNAGNLAGFLGVITIIGLIVQAFFSHPRPIFSVAIWALFALYLLVAVVAVIVS